jgi:hypothetical protein
LTTQRDTSENIVVNLPDVEDEFLIGNVRAHEALRATFRGHQAKLQRRQLHYPIPVSGIIFLQHYFLL